MYQGLVVAFGVTHGGGRGQAVPMDAAPKRAGRREGGAGGRREGWVYQASEEGLVGGSA